MKEPRAYDWSQVGNQSRGILEYLVEYTLDGSFRPMLLEGWELNEDATRYTLHVRRGITWHDGTDFTAADCYPVSTGISGRVQGSLVERPGLILQGAGTQRAARYRGLKRSRRSVVCRGPGAAKESAAHEGDMNRLCEKRGSALKRSA